MRCQPLRRALAGLEANMSRFFVLSVGVIVLVSFLLVAYIPVDNFVKGMIATPGVIGLCSALFQIVRDEASHKKNKQSQEIEHYFHLGAASHMAATVFDKHVEFCEKYLIEVHQLVVTLTREGPTKSALKHAGNLYSIRIEYTAWITPEIESQLMPFENAVRRIGANSNFIHALDGGERFDGQREKAVEEMFEIFNNLMDIDQNQGRDAEATVIAVKEKVRQILQISELTAIREALVKRASASALGQHS